MSPEQFRAIRRKLGLSQNGLAALLRVSSGRTIRKWENHERPITGPAIVIMRLLDRHPEVLRWLR